MQAASQHDGRLYISIVLSSSARLDRLDRALVGQSSRALLQSVGAGKFSSTGDRLLLSNPSIIHPATRRLLEAVPTLSRIDDRNSGACRLDRIIVTFQVFTSDL
jgi:hypothetical protein